MSRRTQASFDVVATALTSLGIDQNAIAEVRTDTDLITLSQVSPGDVLTHCPEPPVSTTGVVIADRISKTARVMLDDLGWGWLDRRGYLSLTAPGLSVRSEIPSTLAPNPNTQLVNLAATGPLTVALAMLNEPERAWGVRELATETGLSPATVSNTLRSFKDVGYATPKNRPLIPELFWKVAEHWQPKFWPVVSNIEQILEVASNDDTFGDVDGIGSGWAESDTFPAMGYGFGISASHGYPRIVYVPSADDIYSLRLRLKEPEGALAHKTILAVAQTPWVTNNRRSGDLLSWASPVVVALDLAKDGRGRKAMLELFKAKRDDVVRVW